MSDNLIVLLSIAVAPAAFLLLFVYLRDRYEREPLGLIGVTFVLGALGMLPAALIELLLEPVLPSSLIVQVFLGIALVEESIKLGVVRIKAYSSTHFNEVMDGIVYAVAAGLGFATSENVVYVLQQGLSAAILRAFLSVPGHAVWAGIMGFYLGLAKCRTASKNERLLLIVKGLIIAIALQSIYSLLAVVGVSLLGWILFLWLMRKALSLSPFRWRDTYGGTKVLPPRRFCAQCGSRLVGDEKFCMNCGFELAS